MRFHPLLLAAALVAGAATTTHAQPTPPLPTLKAVLDTVAITGHTRILTLAAAPGPDISIRSLLPGLKMAVLHTPPAATHEYDLTGIRVLVSKKYNLSNTGMLLVNLMLPDSSTHAPSTRALLPAPLAVTDHQVRRAKNGVLTLDVRPYHLTLPASGVFVVAEGAPEPPYRYLGDTLFANRPLGRFTPSSRKRPSLPSMHVRLVNQAHPERQRLVNSADFICVRDIRTSVEPQTWDFTPRRGTWRKRELFNPKCPTCIISNAGLELVVREL